MTSASIPVLLGLARSLLMYYAIPGRARAWRAFYGSFIQPGELCFDVGAHAGNRTAALLANGARVVAVEPQPAFAALLRRIYGKNPRFALLQCALGASSGRAPLLVSSRTPTISTLSAEWVGQVSKTPSFASARWDKKIDVEVRTLDQLITEFGTPTFCKLDIEGYELEALLGLSIPISFVSFEFLVPTMEKVLACIDRLAVLGTYEFNFIKGEYPRLDSPGWIKAEVIRQSLLALPDDGRAGEVYARLAG
ncbi:MAG: FkbM family methyltransferase [Anaerolineales bacterium]